MRRRSPAGAPVRAASTAQGEEVELYAEQVQMLDIRSQEFYEEEALARRYYYYVDVRGWLFLEQTLPKTIATSLKSDKFLDFFYSRIENNDTGHDADTYPFISRCGKELNFIKPADTPIVFLDLVHSDISTSASPHTSIATSTTTSTPILTFAGNLAVPFRPDALQVCLDTGRIYHPLDVTFATILPRAGRQQPSKRHHKTRERMRWQGPALLCSQLAIRLADNIGVHDPDDEDSAATAAADPDTCMSFTWDGIAHPIRKLAKIAMPAG